MNGGLSAEPYTRRIRTAPIPGGHGMRSGVSLASGRWD